MHHWPSCLQSYVLKYTRSGTGIRRCRCISNQVPPLADPLEGFDVDNLSAVMNAETKSLANRLLTEASFETATANWWHQRSALAQAITLVESRGKEKEDQASALLTFLLKKSSSQCSFRIGFAGSPGAGKSTFIEALGAFVLGISQPHGNPIDAVPIHALSSVWSPNKLAIVCIDPSSLRTGGSILGDKTRMTTLASNPRAFIRPSATQGALGGIAPRTDDVLRLLAQQYPLTFLETVGLGQSEVEVQQSVDMLVLTIPPGGGDDLQGVKKGIVEVADLIVVTKADGSLLTAAKQTAGHYRSAMHFLNGITAHLDDSSDHSPTPVLLTSALTGTGLQSVWDHICQFRRNQIESGRMKRRQQEQGKYWMWKNLQTAVHEYTESDPGLQALAKRLHDDLNEATIPPRVAASILFNKLKQR
jgi:LAO/AO transport system kinase